MATYKIKDFQKNQIACPRTTMFLFLSKGLLQIIFENMGTKQYYYRCKTMQCKCKMISLHDLTEILKFLNARLISITFSHC